MRRFFIALAAVTAGALLALILLVATQAGNRWLVHHLDSWIPGTLTIASWDGRLLDQVTLTDLHYQHQELEIQLDHASLALDPAQLLQGWLAVHSLELGNLAIHSPPAPASAEGEPGFTMPDSLALPLGIRIEQARLNTLTLNGDMLAQQLRGQSWVAWRRFNVARLRGQLAGATLDLQLQGKLSAPYPLTGQLGWSYPLPEEQFDAADAQGQLSLDGPLDEIAIRHELQAPLHLQSQGTIGLVHGKPQLNLEHQWSNQPLPVALAQPTTLGPGQLTTRGPVTALSVAGKSKLKTGEHDLSLSLDGTLSPDTLALAQLKIEQDDQQVQASGALNLSPLSWDLRLEGQLNTAWLHPQLPGNLHLEGHSQGRQENGEWVIQPSQLNAKGKVRQQPFTLEADLQGQPQHLFMTGQFDWADNHATFQGTLADSWKLDSEWQLNKLAALAPSLAGQLRSKLQLRGPRQQPRLSGTLRGQELSWQQWQLDTLDSDFSSLGLGTQQQRLHITAGTLSQSGDPQLTEANLALNGTQQQHTFTLNLRRDGTTLTTRLRGGLNKASWRGRLEHTTLEQPGLGQWHQAKPSDLALSARKQSLQPLCLTHQQSRLCLSGRHQPDRDAKSLSAHLALQHLPLALADDLLGPTLSLKGEINGDFTLTGSPNNPGGQLNLHTDRAAVTFHGEPTPEPLQIQNLDLSSQFSDGRAKTRLALDASVAVIKGDLSHGFALDAPMHGDLSLQAKQLEWLSVLTPQVNDIEGALQAHLAFSGSPNKPQLDGQVRLDEGQMALPTLGIAVSRINLELTGSPKGRIAVSGGARVGDQPASLKGQVNLHQWPPQADLRLQGEKLLVADRPDARVRVSPDLRLSNHDQALALSGEIHIPEAEIAPVELPDNAVNVSEDQVLVHADAPSEQGLPLTTRVNITLGKAVHFVGFGLDATLGGDLVVQQDLDRPIQLNGELLIKEGRYRAYGQNLAIDDGQLIFQGPPDNPGLDIRAIRKIPSDNVVVGVQLTGTLQEPEASLFSNPSLEQSQTMSYLLTGKALGGGSNADNSRLAQALALYGLQKGSGVTEAVGEKLGLDEISIGSDWETSDAALMLGKQLSDRLYLTYTVGLFEAVSTVMLRYTLTRQLHLESKSSTNANSLDLIWEKDFR